MTTHTAPPGAIIPPTVGLFNLDLPDDTWLMRATDAWNLSGDEWEAAYVMIDEDTWASPRSHRSEYLPVVVRRRKVTVEVAANPGDRIARIPGDVWRDWIEYNEPHAADTALVNAIRGAIEVQP